MTLKNHIHDKWDLNISNVFLLGEQHNFSRATWQLLAQLYLNVKANILKKLRDEGQF